MLTFDLIFSQTPCQQEKKNTNGTQNKKWGQSNKNCMYPFFYHL